MCLKSSFFYFFLFFINSVVCQELVAALPNYSVGLLGEYQLPSNKLGQLNCKAVGVAMDEQRGYFAPNVRDHTCLYRAYSGAVLTLQGIEDNTISVHNALTTHLRDSFLGKLNFDSFTNPRLYASLCCAATDNQIAQKIVYFNTDHRHTQKNGSCYAPVAGYSETSSVTSKTFACVQKAIEDTIKRNEKSLFSFLRQDDWQDIDWLEASLCLNGDYQNLLAHIEALHNNDTYSFAFVTTISGGEVGHGVTIVVHKQNNVIEYICMDGCNMFNHGWYQESIDCLHKMVENPDVLKNAIIRYLCATKSFSLAQAEIKELGLENYPLYKDWYHYVWFKRSRNLRDRMITHLKEVHEKIL
jgi:hypothetical protein